METRTLNLPEVELTFDVIGPLPPADGRRPIVMIGQPMDASGFHALADNLSERTTVAYDPRGLGRSVRMDGQIDNDPNVQAEDVHALIESFGLGAVDMFASSGGAVTALALVAKHPGDVATLVAHEPPLLLALPDAAAAKHAEANMKDAYQRGGFGFGMARFIAMSSWQGEFTDEFFAQPPADPATFGLPADDDGTRTDPLMSDRSAAITSYSVDVVAVNAAPTRVLIAAGEESISTVTGRCAVATAQQLGQEVTVFPSHHGGFGAEDGPWPGQAKAFAERLQSVLGD